jgi:pimeloyl-ACP methyl ester carboxylesterase
MTNNRYRIDTFYGKSLEGNPLGSPVERKINIYLPPDYFEDQTKRYPAIYFLHGYSSNDKSWTVTSEQSPDKAIDWNIIPKKILQRIDVDRLLTFEKLDALILEGKLDPFILIQPDGSLEVPNIHNRKDLRGNVTTKGSFYVNSPHSGNYMDYILKDVIGYIDSNFRTIADSSNRALMGGSMGGYGTLYLAILHPEQFKTIAALSPGNHSDLEMMTTWKLKIPIYTEIFGDKMSTEIGDYAWGDIIDTYDLIFSNDNRLLPSIKKNKEGKIIDYNKEAYQNWHNYELINLLEKHPNSLKDLHLQINCHNLDEFGLTRVTEEIHRKLQLLKIDHDYELYSDEAALLTPHILGIGYRILPGIEHCLKYIK